MADERAVDDPVQQLGKLQRDFDDFRSTMLARVARGSTGEVEITLRTTAKPGSLLLQGQTLIRAEYAGLWQWIVDNGLSPGVFGTGDGTTTFVLPDMRGKATVGATVVDPVGKSFGSATATLSVAQLPAHKHSLSDHDGHSHAIHGAGNHSGHNADASDAAPGPGRSIAGNSQVTRGDHGHNESIEGGGKPHTMGNTGSGEPFFVVQPSFAVNFLIWT